MVMPGETYFKVTGTVWQRCCRRKQLEKMWLQCLLRTICNRGKLLGKFVTYASVIASQVRNKWVGDPASFILKYLIAHTEQIHTHTHPHTLSFSGLKTYIKVQFLTFYGSNSKKTKGTRLLSFVIVIVVFFYSSSSSLSLFHCCFCGVRC